MHVCDVCLSEYYCEYLELVASRRPSWELYMCENQPPVVQVCVLDWYVWNVQGNPVVW